MARRLVAALVLSLAVVAVFATAAMAVPGTLKISSLRARSVGGHAGVATALAQTPPPPPRHYEPPTTKPMPHAGPDIPPNVATAAGAALVALGGAGLLALRRTNPHATG